MKTNRNIFERVKLYTFTCFMIVASLALLLSLGVYNNCDLLNVTKVTKLHQQPNLTVTNFHGFEPQNPNEVDPNPEVITSNDKEEACNIFDGKWVYDPEASPLYDAAQCPFLSEQVSCRRNGRPDSEYEKWTWEPKGCNITSIDTRKQMLEKLRDKRVVIVGDSMNRNQWESLACLLYSAVPSSEAHVNVESGSYKIFRAKEYNCSVEFFWSPFLVQQAVDKNSGDRILKLDELAPSSKKWRGADIMVFNTGHWWAHHGKFQSWDVFHRKGKAAEMDTESALGLAMETWSRWIDTNIDAYKTRVFFRSISPEHKGNDWCYNQTQPIADDSYVPIFPLRMRQIVESKIREMKTPVTYLNVTGLSQYRKDGHPSIYKTKKGKTLVAMNELRPESCSDCSHWCLPGVPDTWNRLLFASIYLETFKAITIS